MVKSDAARAQTSRTQGGGQRIAPPTCEPDCYRIARYPILAQVVGPAAPISKEGWPEANEATLARRKRAVASAVVHGSYEAHSDDRGDFFITTSTINGAAFTNARFGVRWLLRLVGSWIPYLFGSMPIGSLIAF
jgi:hypothetical protein